MAVIALIVFGPRRLPEIARTLGKTLSEFKRQASDLRNEFESGLQDDDVADEVTDEPALSEPAPSEPEAADQPVTPEREPDPVAPRPENEG